MLLSDDVKQDPSIVEVIIGCVPGYTRAQVEAVAQDILTELRVHGYAIVPVEATAEMKLAGSDANLDLVWVATDGGDMVGKETKVFTEAECDGVWRTMVAARPR